MSAQYGPPMISPNRCDYRAKWMEFTRRLGSCATLDELASRLVAAAVETLGATGAVLYLSHGGDGLRAAAAAGTPYTRDDLGLMEVIAAHAAGLLVTVQMCVLSSLSESVLKRLDDRGFWRDALDTVAQTVSRVTSLLGRLGEAPLGDALGGRT